MKELLAPYGAWPLYIMAVLCCAVVLFTFGAPVGGRRSQWLFASLTSGLLAICFIITFLGGRYVGIGLMITGFLLIVKFQDRLRR
jgi:hypothetical protein